MTTILCRTCQILFFSACVYPHSMEILQPQPTRERRSNLGQHKTQAGWREAQLKTRHAHYPSWLLLISRSTRHNSDIFLYSTNKYIPLKLLIRFLIFIDKHIFSNSTTHINGSGHDSLVTRDRQPFTFLMPVDSCSSVTDKWSYCPVYQRRWRGF